jgi:hypothetical protein
MTVVSFSATVLVLAASIVISILAGQYASLFVMAALTAFWSYQILQAWLNRRNGLAIRLGLGIFLIALMWSIHCKVF